MTALRFIALSAACLALASCENMKKSGSSSSDPYASNYGSDGHYNPYPGQTGYASGSTPKYQTPPSVASNSFPSEPEKPNPYAFGGSSSHSSSSASPSYTAPKKTTSSSSSGKKKTSTVKTASKSTPKKSGSRYTVGKGDTLSAIARKKGTSVARIKAANGLKSDLIRPGQALKIP